MATLVSKPKLQRSPSVSTTPKCRQRLFRLVLSTDGRTADLVPHLTASQHGKASVLMAPPSEPALDQPMQLRRTTSEELDAAEDVYFEHEDPILLRAERFDDQASRRQAKSLRSGAALPKRTVELQHRHWPPPPEPEKFSRWEKVTATLLRHNGFQVGGQAMAGQDRRVAQTAEAWHQRHGYCDRSIPLWQQKEALRAERAARKPCGAAAAAPAASVAPAPPRFSLTGRTLDDVSFVDANGDNIRFFLTRGKLLLHINSECMLSNGNPSGEVTQLMCNISSAGVAVQDQHQDMIYHLPANVHTELSALAIRAGVPHNIPPNVMHVARCKDGERPMMGEYDLIRDETANGFPLWRQRDGDHWLYYDDVGYWNFGDALERDQDFQCCTGFMFADGDPHEFEHPHLVTAWHRTFVQEDLWLGCVGEDVIVDPSILVSDVPPCADQLAAIAASEPPLPPGHPAHFSPPPLLSGERSAELAAALGMDLLTYRALMQLQQRDITPEDFSILGALDESQKPSKLDVAVLHLFPTDLSEQQR